MNSDGQVGKDVHQGPKTGIDPYLCTEKVHIQRQSSSVTAREGVDMDKTGDRRVATGIGPEKV